MQELTGTEALDYLEKVKSCIINSVVAKDNTLNFVSLEFSSFGLDLKQTDAVLIFMLNGQKFVHKDVFLQDEVMAEASVISRAGGAGEDFKHTTQKALISLVIRSFEKQICNVIINQIFDRKEGSNITFTGSDKISNT